MTNELTYEQETVRSVFGAYINDLKVYSSKPDRPMFRRLEEVRDKAIQALEPQRNLTNEELYQSFINLEAENERLHEALESSIPIPSGATNGDVIKAVFPNVEVYKNNRMINIHAYIGIVADITASEDWWNTPYREGDTE